MTDVRALTLRQPWASLVAVGAKTIETRGWSTDYRGPLLIHAAKRTPDVDGVQGLARFGDWWVADTRLGTFTLAHVPDDDDYPDSATEYPIPLGVVVASCRLVACVPIRETETEDDDEWPRLVVNKPGSEPWALLGGGFGAGVYGIGDQLPFGDFTPGRFAWLLEDVKPTTERCPRCWGLGYVPFDDRADVVCSLCQGLRPSMRDDTRCAPVPMRGRQGLWTPKPEDWPA